jgi:hypothetical protein
MWWELSQVSVPVYINSLAEIQCLKEKVLIWLIPLFVDCELGQLLGGSSLVYLGRRDSPKSNT